MRTRATLSLALIAAGSMLGCGGSDGGSSGTPSAPTSPSTPSTPATPSTPSTPSTPATPTVTSIAVTNNAFSPAATTVPVGATVTWTWSACTTTDPDGYGSGGGTSCTDHNVTWDDSAGTASATQSEGTYQRTFPVAGTYTYHCVVHGMEMSGKVVVQ